MSTLNTLWTQALYIFPLPVMWYDAPLGSDWAGGTPGYSRWAGVIEKYSINKLMFSAKTLDNVGRGQTKSPGPFCKTVRPCAPRAVRIGENYTWKDVILIKVLNFKMVNHKTKARNVKNIMSCLSKVIFVIIIVKAHYWIWLNQYKSVIIYIIY